jgi:hypothetical protein
MLYIRLGLLKNLVKPMDQSRAGFMYLNKIPRISDAKIKEGVFVVPHIMELIHNKN